MVRTSRRASKPPLLPGKGRSLTLSADAGNPPVPSTICGSIHRRGAIHDAHCGVAGDSSPATAARCAAEPAAVFVFSQPMDRHYADILLFSVSRKQPIASIKGKWVGDGSVYKIELTQPPPFGETFTFQFPRDPQRSPRTIDGVLFDVNSMDEQTFATRAKGSPPQRLAILFRNDNLHATLADTLAMLRSGIDIVEINPIKLADAWVSNHW